MPTRLFSVTLLRIMIFAISAITLSLPVDAQFAPKAEFALEYNYVHSNAPPDECGCFSMFGGSASAAIALHRGFAIVAEFSGVHATDIAPTSRDLTLTTYLFGPRYTYHAGRRLTPFGETLVGLSHASGTLAPSNLLSNASSNSFAAAIGGGLNYNIGRAVSIRIVQADYLLTTFANHADNHQNNLRLGAGIVFRFGRD
ncbi:MAG: outer membrane beta-barrel protein [Acidobacteriaceae bacterium]